MGGVYATLVIALMEVGEKEGLASQRAFTGRILVRLGLIMAPVAALVLLVPGPFVRLSAPGFSAERIPLSANLMRLAIVTMLCWAVFAGFRALLEARGLYLISGTVYLVIGLVTLATLALAATRLGIYALAVGPLAGTALAVVLQYLAGGRRLAAGRDGQESIPIDREQHRVIERRLWRAFVPMSIAASVTQVNLLVDNAFGSLLPAGRVTLLGFAYVIVANADLMIMTAIAEVALPRLSVASRQGDDSLGRLLNRQLRMMLLLTAPLAVGFITFGLPVARILLERGRFGPEDSQAVAGLLVCYGPALLFIGVFALFLRTLAARHRPRVVTWISLFAIAANAGLDALLVRPFGIQGVATATTLVTILCATLLVPVVRRETGSLVAPGDGFYALRVLAAAGLMGAALLAYGAAFESRLGTGTLLLRLLDVAGGGLLSAIVYLLVLRTLRVEEARSLMRRLAGRFLPGRPAS